MALTQSTTDAADPTPAPGPGQELRLKASYGGYPQVLTTASGRPLAVVVDATRGEAFQQLWGMSLLERNLRLVERLGAHEIHVLARPEDHQRAVRRHFPGLTEAAVHALTADPIGSMRRLTEASSGPVLLLQGQVVYDRRLIGELWQQHAPAAICGQDGAAALLVDASSSALLSGTDWPELESGLRRSPAVHRLDDGTVDTHISLLRKYVPPQMIRVHDSVSRARADTFLKDLAGKGINDLIAEFVHPPIEFFLTRLVARTRITPNQISYFNALLNVAAIPLIALGWLWPAIACNLVRGVTDGVDGKLARLTLRESTGGDQIDHVVDRLYLPAFFLALGWHLGNGAWLSPPALLAYLLQGFYWPNRLLASWFANFVGASSGEYSPWDRVVRRFWPKRNICVLLLLVSMLFAAPLAGLGAMAALSGFMLIYRVVRLDQESRRLKRERDGALKGGKQPS